MSVEIERKYLVVGDEWRAGVTRTERYRQGYLAKTELATIRIRCAESGATLTIKSSRRGLLRDELNVDLPLARGEEMLRTQCLGRMIEKVRHFVGFFGMTWHVDVFASPYEGLVLAEVELDHPDQDFRTPPWAGAEVTHDPRYQNSRLALGPLRLPRGSALAGRAPLASADLTTPARGDTTLRATN
jgi:adenylate cyclase